MDQASPAKTSPHTKKRGVADEKENRIDDTALALVTEEPKAHGAENNGTEVALFVKRGGGKGLKAVQTSQDQSKTTEWTNGGKEELNRKVKEQKLFHAKSNTHVQTKVMTEDQRKKVGRNGTVTVISSTTVRKVAYL